LDTPDNHIILKNEMHYEGYCIRPPSEADSILLQATLGCSHNKCTFCGTYADKPFSIKDEKIILHDILFAARYMKDLKRLFIMDGDALAIPQQKLMWILEKIRKHLPWVTRVGAYANTKNLKIKTHDDLKQLYDAGLKILYYGIESGDNNTLEKIKKGTTQEELIQLGIKAKEAGMKLSVTVLLGIAGRDRSIIHAQSTGALLSKMSPEHTGALTVMLIPGTPLYDDYEKGIFILPSQKELLIELKEMIASTHITRGLFLSNHASNYLPLKIRMPKDKQKAIETIEMAINNKIGLKPEWMRGL